MFLKYSFIIPVYNRPEEVAELLQSFTKLKGDIPFEVVLVEDGSTLSAENEVKTFQNQLTIMYLKKENTGPGDSRNYGMQRASGDYFIVLDSDVLLPPKYLEAVQAEMQREYTDCFGGPDAADQSFSPIQKAINFAMTSFLTTGGIRGGKDAVKDFEPRSFNMGISKKAFEETGGFGKIHPGEDPDLAIRIRENGFQTRLFEKAFVYHKRRIDWDKFYIQVNKFGKVRPILTAWHPKTSSPVFWFPTLFSLGVLFSIIVIFMGWWLPILILVFYLLAIFLSAAAQTQSLTIGVLAIRATLTQFFGYGYGFLKSTYYIRLLRKNPKIEFPELFF